MIYASPHYETARDFLSAAPPDWRSLWLVMQQTAGSDGASALDVAAALAGYYFYTKETEPRMAGSLISEMIMTETRCACIEDVRGPYPTFDAARAAQMQEG